MTHYYKFKPQESAYFFCLDTLYPCKVYTSYTSDKYNHPAPPHRRYVIQFPSGRLNDVSENELLTQCEMHSSVAAGYDMKVI